MPKSFPRLVGNGIWKHKNWGATGALAAFIGAGGFGCGVQVCEFG